MLSGDVSDPVMPSGDVSDPVIPSGAVSDPVIPSGAVSDPVIPAGAVSDPVIPSGDVSDPVIPPGDAQSEPLHTLNAHQAAVKAVSWCPWSPHLLASGGGTADRSIRFWNASTGQLLSTTTTNSQVSQVSLTQHYHHQLTGETGVPTHSQLSVLPPPTHR